MKRLGKGKERLKDLKGNSGKHTHLSEIMSGRALESNGLKTVPTGNEEALIASISESLKEQGSKLRRGFW